MSKKMAKEVPSTTSQLKKRKQELEKKLSRYIAGVQ